MRTFIAADEVRAAGNVNTDGKRPRAIPLRNDLAAGHLESPPRDHVFRGTYNYAGFPRLESHHLLLRPLDSVLFLPTVPTRGRFRWRINETQERKGVVNDRRISGWLEANQTADVLLVSRYIGTHILVSREPLIVSQCTRKLRTRMTNDCIRAVLFFF